MIRVNSLKLNIDHTPDDVRSAILKRLMIKAGDLLTWQPVKVSIDARHKDDIRYVYSVDVTVRGEDKLLRNRRISDISASSTVTYHDPVSDIGSASELLHGQRPVIIGAGPAGLFCGLKLAEAGLSPLIIERGAPADERTADVQSFWDKGTLKPDSNVQFGEGGAGTFSDGKLNTMIHDGFGRMHEVFRIFIEHGADPSIMYLAKPHVGTDRLTSIVRSIRHKIVALGGEVRFHCRMTDISLKNGRVSGITLDNGEQISCDTLVLAIGHSARDTFSMLAAKGIAMERKPFAAGVRVQHPQELINRDRYGAQADRLPAADYKLTYTTAAGRGVYSFCMCPGGFVVNASSEPGMLVVNGMSNSDRSEYSANSAIVVTVGPEDFEGDSVLAGIEFQRKMERGAYIAANGSIPVQYYSDFIKGRSTEAFIATHMPNTKGAYAPGDITSYLPGYISDSIKEAFPAFDRSIHGYADDHALLMGVESRTSSPVRLLRGTSLESINVEGLYPCGEGAGYAGGITSAAIDGLKTYEAIINRKGN